MAKANNNLSLLEKRPVNELILFAIFALTEKGEVCAFERLVKECFNLFPRPFSFTRYPKWPDSRKLDRSLRSLRSKKMITGDPKTSFSLTKHGKEKAKEIALILRQKKLL